jgi:3',5'-cyclic AMP phosphodiesterase CpdA
MTRIAHLTDVHFGAEDPAVVETILVELNLYRPDLVAISGDLTQGGRSREFRAARGFIERIDAPTLAVPGNHDLTPYNLIERFTDPYARWRSAISAETEPQWQNDQVIVVGLNTARRFGLNWDWSRGRVTHGRLRRVLARLDAAPTTLARVVVAHHPLLPPRGRPRTPVAGGAAGALAAFTRHHVDLVLAGHLHRGYARLASVQGERPLILQGGTATSVRLRGEPNTYHRIEIGPRRDIRIESRIWTGDEWIVQKATQADDRALARLRHTDELHEVTA